METVISKHAEYYFTKEIGSGSYANVYLAYRKPKLFNIDIFV